MDMSLIDKFHLKWNKYMNCEPTPKQLAFLLYEGKELLYGGAAGGGKSFVLILSALQYTDVPGYSAIIFRQSLTELKGADGIIPKALSLLGPWIQSKDVKYNASEHIMEFKTTDYDGKPGEPARLEFGYIGDAGTKVKYQGRAYQFCVHPDTLVWMADNTKRPMKDVRIGDYVQTLIGPKVVTKKHQVVKPCCLITTQYGKQIQSIDHRLLSLPDQLDVYTSNQFGTSHKSTLQTEQQCYGLWLSHETLYQDRSRIVEQEVNTRLLYEAKAASLTTQGNYDVMSSQRHLKTLQLQQLYDSVMPLQLMIGGYASSHSCSYETFYEPFLNINKDYLSSYLNGFRQYGEYLNKAQFEIQQHPPLPKYVGKPYLLCLPYDVLGNTLKHTPVVKVKYDHPYSLDTFSFSSFQPVAFSSSTLHREMLLQDITVADASHYITEWGCVNSNCGWDELTHHVESDYQYMFTRLRQNVCPIHKLIDGKPNYVSDCPICQMRSSVPLRVRAATNPGGRGASWVKRHFRIEPDRDVEIAARSGERVNWVGRNPDAPFLSAFLADNPYIDQQSYRDSFRRVDEETRAQLELGSWAEGGSTKFKRPWFKRYSTNGNHYILGRDRVDEHGAFTLRGMRKIFLSVDTAASADEGQLDEELHPKKDPSWTVISVFALTPNWNLLWLEIDRFREEVPEVIERCEQAWKRWRNVAEYSLVENRGTGLAVVQELLRRGVSVKVARATKDKVVRATPAMMRAKMNRIWLPQQAPWLKDCEDELFTWQGYPDEQDDIVDTLAHAVNDVEWPENLESVGDDIVLEAELSYLQDNIGFVSPQSIDFDGFSDLF